MECLKKEKMDLAEFSRHEDDRQRFNVYETCRELAATVQDSPGPKGTMNPMTGLVGEQPEEQFFWDTTYLNEYLGASAEKRKQLPGHIYYSKLLKFIASHFHVGELYVEYRITNCLLEGELCSFCSENPWVGPEIDMVPRPVPGENGKFIPVDETPTADRQIDDFQPRVQLAKLYK